MLNYLHPHAPATSVTIRDHIRLDRGIDIRGAPWYYAQLIRFGHVYPPKSKTKNYFGCGIFTTLHTALYPALRSGTEVFYPR